jgi:hypothetical protein
MESGSGGAGSSEKGEFYIACPPVAYRRIMAAPHACVPLAGQRTAS